MKALLLSVFVVLAGVSVHAQTCGTVVTQEQLDFMNRFIRTSPEGRTQSVNVQIPIQFHYVTRDDGTGGLTDTQTNSVLDNLNSYYVNANIEFFMPNPVNVIQDTDDYDWDANEGIAASNDVSRVINIYFFNSINSNGRPLCGYTRFPPSSDRIFVAYGCVTGGTTLEHELGHYFSLFHTHGTTNTGTTDELVNQSNCESAGDRLCDTPADPNLSGQISNCIYTGSATDANGDIFNPQVENIMSYAPDQCVDRFTNDQYDRVRNGFENGRIYLAWTSDEFTGSFTADSPVVCIESDVNFRGVGFGVTQWSWEFEGGAPATSSSQNPRVSYENPGEFDVTLTITNNAGTEVVIDRSNFIRVNDPALNSITDTLLYDGTDGIAPFMIENADFGVTFIESNVSETDDGSGSIFIDNYNYLSEVPGNIDIFSLKNLSTEGVNHFDLSFDYAYAFRNIEGEDFFFYDSLAVVYNNGCLEKDIVLWQRGGSQLSFFNSSVDPYVPTNSEWRTVELEIPLNGEDAIIPKFKNVSYNGNNLYIDNITITPDLSLATPEVFRIVDFENGELTIRWVDNAFNEFNYVLLKSRDGGTPEEIILPANAQLYEDGDLSIPGDYEYELYALGRNGTESSRVGPLTFSNVVSSINLDEGIQFVVYPNPAKSIISVEGIEQNSRIELLNGLGQRLISTRHQSERTDFDIKAFSDGIYYIRVTGNQSSTIKRVLITK